MNMRNKKLYTLFLLAVFMISLGFRALHFLEHQDTDKYEKTSDDGHNDCQVCYIVFGTAFLSADEVCYSSYELGNFSEYRPSFFDMNPVVQDSYGTFSLRAPPIC